MIFGREISQPADSLFPLPIQSTDGNETTATTAYTEKLRQSFKNTYDIAKHHLKKNIERATKDHDTRLTKHQYTTGTLVDRFDIRSNLL